MDEMFTNAGYLSGAKNALKNIPFGRRK